jgi:hypothetical protein
MENIGTENIYIYLKSRAKKIKEIFLTKKSSLSQSLKKSQNESINKENNIFPSNITNLYYNKFTTYMNNKSIECPNTPSENWYQSSSDKKDSMELKNVIYQLKDEINYEYFDNIIKAEIILKGESTFWLFLHCGEKFNDKTAVLTISKEDFSQRCFVSLGTFINKELSRNNLCDKNYLNNRFSNINKRNKLNINNIDNNIDYNEINLDNNFDYNNIPNNNNYVNEYEYVIFRKQELVEEISLEDRKEKLKKKKKEDKYFINDPEKNICYLNIIVYDNGQNIDVKIKVNDGKYENEIKGDFFMPSFDLGNISVNSSINESYKLEGSKVMIAGTGDECKIIYLSNEINYKEAKSGQHYKKQNDCQCCMIN